MEYVDLENIYEQKAQRILTYLRKDLRHDLEMIPRPFFVELTGSPSAGKTTVITELDKFLRRQGFRVLRPQEGAEVIRHIERTTPLYNIRTGLYALSQLIDLSHGHLYDVVIFDRCVFDTYGWMNYWLKKGKLTETERDLIQSFFLSRFWINNIDLAYFMVCEPVEAMAREQRIALSQKLGETTNPVAIQTLVERYQAAFEILSPTYSQLRLLDTTSLDEQQVVQLVADDVLDTFERKAQGGH